MSLVKSCKSKKLKVYKRNLYNLILIFEINILVEIPETTLTDIIKYEDSCHTLLCIVHSRVQ